MEVVDLPEPAEPGPGEVVVGPMSVGLCGSDYHFFDGAPDRGGGGRRGFPRVQGHEVGGDDRGASARTCDAGLQVGRRVALWPLHAVRALLPVQRRALPTSARNFKLIGIHVDGGLQELLRGRRRTRCSPIDAPSALAAMVEPVSIAVRAVRRGRVEAGEPVVILGAGPIGQSHLPRRARARRGGAGGRSAGEPARG